MSASKTVILNGTKMWLTCIAFVVLHGGTGIWWASSINTNVKLLKEQMTATTAILKDSYSGVQAARDNATQDAKVEVLTKELTSHTADGSIHHHLKYRVDTLEKVIERNLPVGELRNVTK